MITQLTSQRQHTRYSTFIASLLVMVCTAIPLQAQVLTQTDKDLGHGYHLQESRQINVAGRWHSDHSFKFLYFEKRHLCQCTEFSIADDGKFAIYQVNGSKEIMSFERDKNKVRGHPKLPAGKLVQVVWGKNPKKVELHILPPEAAATELDKIIKKTLSLR
ncbi:hypothetical protein [Undibacterium flavidum]|uniref:Uncharacterized protein n=1 Tax=Undibacterium flavidum TaxID=2762297 RepID=A0ABR6YGZ1_9BURK|nr:hypothetical protein [Undibacterium flavidum]MBC3875860.1 hypothetical protein [Undibacterium flavidum]